MKFHITDMTCSHCVSMVTKAIVNLHSEANVEANLADKTVTVIGDIDAANIIDALNEAGYPATVLKASCCNPANSCNTQRTKATL